VRHSVWRRFGGQEPGGGVGRVTTEQGGRSANGALLLDFVRSEMETGENYPGDILDCGNGRDAGQHGFGALGDGWY